ncbi:MAG: cytidine deaminase [Candidatus Melainabacteria bacterium]|nr:cytidine deaminase [Candidatus Melainabacteria bacterium]
MSESHEQGNIGVSHQTEKLLIERETMPNYSGMFEQALVQDMVRIENKPLEQVLLALLPRATNRASAGLSKFNVGAIVLGASGNIYLGSNIEIPNQVCGFTVHAEQSAFANAFNHGERDIKAVVVTAAPCGHCRQFMTEFSISYQLPIIVKGAAPTTLANLLPEAFGPVHLGNNLGVALSTGRSLKLFEAFDAEPELERAALKAAEISYAPYSFSPSGAAVSTKSGRIYSGSYIESVAFNPSLPPLQAALVSLIQSEEKAEDIVEAVVVELKNASITQEDSARAVLRGVQSGARFNLVYAQPAINTQ